MEKWMLSLAKKGVFEENKHISTKKVTFKEDEKKKKKRTKDAFDMEGLQIVVKNLLDEVVDLNRQVAEEYSYRRSYRPFKGTHTISLVAQSSAAEKEDE